MPRRPQPPTLRLAAIKAVGRWSWKILDFFSILISRHLERICYGCKNSHEVKTFERNMHQFRNDSNKLLIVEIPQSNFKKFRLSCSLRATPSWGRRDPLSPSHHRCLKICCKRWCLYLCLCICICLGSHHYTRLCLIFVFVTVSLSLLEDLLQELYVFLSLYLRLPLYLFLYLSLSTYVMHVSLFLSLFLYLCPSPFR